MNSLLSGLLHRVDRVRRRVLLHRRGLAALTAALAVLVTVQAAATPPDRTTRVWVAAHAVPAGQVLTRDDLRPAPHLADEVPEGAIDAPGDVVGRTSAVPLARGQVLTAHAVVADGWLHGHPGLAAVPVRLTDPAVAGLVHPGDHVDLVATDPQSPGEAAVLVPDATVLAVPAASERTRSPSLPGRLVVLGVPPGLADTVVSHSAAWFLSVVWSG